MPKPKWVWSAWGKHPLAKDYIQLGAATSLSKAFAGWMAKGYRRLSSQADDEGPACAWRFWAKGDRRHTLLCGTIQTSSDTIGRPFPLLLMGSGPVNGWQKHWPLIPPALDGTWRRLEHLSSYKGDDIRSFGEVLATLAAPRPSWRDLRKKYAPGLFSEHSPGLAAVPHGKDHLGRYAGQQVAWCRLQAHHGARLLTQSLEFHDLIHRGSEGPPSVVFMGGVPSAAYIAFFQRSLNSADFARLWRPTITDPV